MLLGVLLLKEKIPKSHLVAIGICFIGILIIINPLTNQFNYFVIVPVLQPAFPKHITIKPNLTPI